MRSFVPAMIPSRIRYALPLIGSMWGLGNYTSHEPQKTSFRKQDITRLQSIQRTALIMTLPPSPQLQYRPTTDLLLETKSLSVHQLIVYTTLALTIRIIESGRPANLSSIFSHIPNHRTRSNMLVPPRLNLNTSLETFMNQAPRLFNMMPDHLKSGLPLCRLRGPLKNWVTNNIRPKV